MVGDGKWRLRFDENGDCISVELWANDLSLRGKIYKYEVIDIKPR